MEEGRGRKTNVESKMEEGRGRKTIGVEIVEDGGVESNSVVWFQSERDKSRRRIYFLG
jgi:hypothetical protein